MNVLSRTENIHWLPKPNTAEILLTDELPPPELCTAAYVFAFDGDRLLMADLDRGVDIPGGHIDPGETGDAAMRREVLEETGATVGPARLFAVQKLVCTGDKPAGYKYPFPVSYQLMYVASGVTPGVFTQDEDSKGAVMIARADAENVPWIANNRALYDHALTLATAASAVNPHKGFSQPSR
ncbi:MAG: NUDIX domain-containing protein [Micavibrio sp.]|nr:NUDIX domain-containing protein [Micavibrio sp.]